MIGDSAAASNDPTPLGRPEHAGLPEQKIIRATAPGRVNLIGDHTDYMGGLAMPMAIQMATVITGTRSNGRIQLTSDGADGVVQIDLPVTDPSSITPSWGRYVAAVSQVLGSTSGITGEVTSTIPLGSGLSSSAALEVATALALGDDGSPIEVSKRTQQAEVLATAVPCGIMDQLAITSGSAGHAMLMDFTTLAVAQVPVPADMCFWVLHSGQQRTLAGSAYAERRAQCETAQAQIGPLREATTEALDSIADPVVRARARHVRDECRRVLGFADALAAGDSSRAGALMLQSHMSLRNDFEVSTQALDDLVDKLCATPGVHGARLTGAGFGGCVVALADPGVELDGWHVSPSDGARVEVLDQPS
ncbi:MAG TPA: galactokinase family protein [Microthrixaceae bacterium]|nr:galactokinase family protein [Microthrixaceae bacterium]